MKLTAHEKIAASRDTVWSRLTDFQRLEKMAADHATVKRVEGGELPSWEAHVEWRGMNRDIALSVVEMTGPETLRLAGTGSGIAADIHMALLETGPGTTILDLEVELRGKTLGGKAIVQGLKVARATIQEKFQGRIKSVARTMSKGLS